MFTHTRNTLINALHGSGVGKTARELASYIGYPEASVRRMIGELRAEGHNIATVAGFYRLQTPASV